MRNLSCLLVGLLLLLGCQSAPSDIVIDSFEGQISPETVDLGSSEGSIVEVGSSKAFKICSEQSLRIEYDLKPSGYMWIARGYDLDVEGAGAWEVEPNEVKWKKFNAVTLYMHGNNSGGVIAFDLKDSGKEVWRFLLDDDFTGWKKIICRFDNFFPRNDWQPETAEANGILDFPIKSFQFEPRLPGKGTYYFDCVTVSKVKK